MPEIVAVIPAYNEAERIAPVIAGARNLLPVLVVDDGSKDATAAVAAANGAEVLRQSPNQGKGKALRAGFRWALEQGYEAVMTLDADGQHDPAEIPKFLEVYRRQQPDLIIGARNFGQIPLVRRASNTFGRWLFSWAIGQPIPDNQSGYRLLSRRMMEATLASQEHGFEFEVEMIGVCVERGFRLEWTPIRTIYGDERSHISPLKHIVHYGRVVWQTRQRRLHAGKV